MLFNSYGFILVFLPLTLLLFHLLKNRGLHRLAIAGLTFCSLMFYAWWSVKGLVILLTLMACNYGFTRWLIDWKQKPRRHTKWVLATGIFLNLGVLVWFKYWNFLVATADEAFGWRWPLAGIFLPLGISFFTFQKIALLIDTWKGKVVRIAWLDYALFVSFFPQLIAGPIVHHSEVMPQFRAGRVVTVEQFVQGLAVFVIGLAKKVLVADTMARFASPVFDAAATGLPVSFADAWTAALSYTLQIYFDFSGYSDMAIGGALLFGIRLPLNFASPYKASSIVEFWRRWHMTLSRFLRDYLYIPLGGNRHGFLRRYANLFLTMLLGGLWHGAGWTFVIWGAMHGSYLIVNHLWRTVTNGRTIYGMEIFAPALTFLAVVFGWVFFRASNIDAAVAMVHGLTGTGHATVSFVNTRTASVLIVILLGIVWFSPNTQELTAYTPPGGQIATSWPAVPKSAGAKAAALGILFGISFLSLSRVTEFIYFQF
jgi:alginate O-acetyltransferase complex protein AlgI